MAHSVTLSAMYDSAISAANAANSCVPPANTKLDLREFDCNLHLIIAKWLKKHGRLVRPKLTDNQKEELKQVFKLMDDDGSGAIDIEELGAAFKLLGFQLSRNEIQQLVEEVDEDGSGELEYPEFLEIMTTTLNRIALEKKSGSQIPFALMATAYRRKKILGDVLENTTASLAGVVKTGEEELERAKERNAVKEQDRLDTETRLSLGVLANAHRSGALMRTAELSQVHPLLLASTFGARELRAVAELLSNKSATWQPGAPRQPPRKSCSQHHLPPISPPDVMLQRRKSSHDGPVIRFNGGNADHTSRSSSSNSVASPGRQHSPHRGGLLRRLIPPNPQISPHGGAARTNLHADKGPTPSAARAPGAAARISPNGAASPCGKPRLLTGIEEIRVVRRHMGPTSDVFMPVKGCRLPAAVRDSMPAALPQINKRR